MSQPIVIEGRIAVQAVVESANRPVYMIYIHDQRSQHHHDLITTLQSNGIPHARVDEDTIAGIAQGHTHGGIIALAGERRYGPIDTIARTAKEPFVAMLDGIEDPYNFGQAIRALYASGAHGLIVRKRNWLSAEGIITRSSAGASERIAIAQVNDPFDAIQHFKQRGLQIACSANRGNAITLHRADLKGPLFVFIGGEKRGISKRILKHADLLLRIPYARQFAHSLGATAAASVIAFEVARQRGVY